MDTRCPVHEGRVCSCPTRGRREGGGSKIMSKGSYCPSGPKLEDLVL